eukprot:SM000069S20732  [mRNA]  locus=s69:489857:492043:+ [translate_table: standard]
MMETTFVMAGNASIVGDMRFRGGPKLLVQICEIQGTFVGRTILRPLTPEFPCFAAAHFTMMGQPELDCAIKVMDMDVMCLPGVDSRLRTDLRNGMSGQVVWPRSFRLALQELHLRGEAPEGTLAVEVLQARGLPGSRLLADVFVKIWIRDGQEVRTTTRTGSCDPLFGETLRATVNDSETEVLHLAMMHREFFTMDRPMGVAKVSLSQLKHRASQIVCRLLSCCEHLGAVELTPSQVFSQELLLELHPPLGQKLPKVCRKQGLGSLQVKLTFEQFETVDQLWQQEHPSLANPFFGSGEASGSGLLLVHVIEGLNLQLPKGHHQKVYCRVHAKGEMHKTRAQKGVQDPKWDEEFEFLLEQPLEGPISFEVYQKSRQVLYLGGHRRCLLGELTVPMADVVEKGRLVDIWQLRGGAAQGGQLRLELTWQAHHHTSSNPPPPDKPPSLLSSVLGNLLPSSSSWAGDDADGSVGSPPSMPDQTFASSAASYLLPLLGVGTQSTASLHAAGGALQKDLDCDSDKE